MRKLHVSLLSSNNPGAFISHLFRPIKDLISASTDILEDAIQNLVAQVRHADVNVIASRR